MNVSSDLDAEGTLTIGMRLTADDLDRARGRKQDAFREALLEKLDEAFMRWTQIDLGLVEREDEEPQAQAADDSAPPDDEPLRSRIDIGDWVYIQLDGGRSVTGELVEYSTEEVVVRSKWEQLIDVWPAKIVTVSQTQRPRPEDDE